MLFLLYIFFKDIIHYSRTKDTHPCIWCLIYYYIAGNPSMKTGTHNEVIIKRDGHIRFTSTVNSILYHIVFIYIYIIICYPQCSLYKSNRKSRSYIYGQCLLLWIKAVSPFRELMLDYITIMVLSSLFRYCIFRLSWWTDILLYVNAKQYTYRSTELPKSMIGNNMI